MVNSTNNKRIAKNTFLLYFRTFITIILSLYSFRVVLDALGETDFGVYNIVGGVVVLFAFVQTAMTSATQRFINYEMGCGNSNSISRVFSMSMTVHISIALLVILFAETIGLWFVNTQLNIPENRQYAAQWVYQFSVLATCFNLIRMPYHATIIAHERMSFYAYLSIFESILKLVIIYVLIISPSNKLILYSILVSSVSLVLLFIYKIYCNLTFKVTKYRLFWDRELYAKILSFTWWSLFGSAANTGVKQGLNVLFNIFNGVIANAALGIATQVQVALTAFMGNLNVASNPQIVKYYAEGKYSDFIKLINQVSKFSFLLVYLLALPLIICADPILHLWLNEVPEYTVLFTKLVLAYSVIDALSMPFWMGVQATGNIAKYQCLISTLILINLPIAFLLLYFGYSPVYVLFVRVIVNVIVHIARVIFLKNMVCFSLIEYARIIVRLILVVIITSLVLSIFYNYTSENLFIKVIQTISVSLIVNVLAFYLIALVKEERLLVVKLAKNYFLSKFQK